VNPDDVILVAGGAETSLGKAIARHLERSGYTAMFAPDEQELQLRDRSVVAAFFERVHPRYVFCVAGRSGGIEANRRHPATLMLDNLAVETNVLSSARSTGVEKLLYLASSCVYPREAGQPLHVRSLFTSALEPTNEAYAVAKLAGIALCKAIREEDGLPFVSAIPANMFGPDDDFSEDGSHVIGALIRRMHAAVVEGQPAVVLWGTGTPRREFVPVDDVASAAVHVMEHYSGVEPINLGGGVDLSIAELAREVAAVVGFRGRIEFDPSRPDGMPRKVLDSTALFELGWTPRISFRDALNGAYEGFREQLAHNAQLVGGAT
jgi:GDP-L-fucose synthase